jgi:prolyl 4-hydroxylase
LSNKNKKKFIVPNFLQNEINKIHYFFQKKMSQFLFVEWFVRNIEERQEVVYFDFNQTLAQFSLHLFKNIMKISYQVDPVLFWGQTNMTEFLSSNLNEFFENGDSIRVECTKDVKWIQEDVKECELKQFHLINTVSDLEPRFEKQLTNESIFLVQNFLSLSECKHLIEQSEILGYAKVNFDLAYRSNERLMVQNKTMADIIFERILTLKSIPKQIFQWRLFSLNPQFRFCKYVKGQFFDKHLDGCFIQDEQTKSFYTLNIYLNDNFVGGDTRFYFENILSVQPVAGLAVLFDHQTKSYLHDGAIIDE